MPTEGPELAPFDTPFDITVVIPARNGAGTIAAQLDALAAQRTTCSWELIVADNGSTDGTRAVVLSHPVTAAVPTRVIDASRAIGHNPPRNDGVAAARGLLVLLCDCDDEVDPDWVHHYWRALGAGPSVIAAGPVETWRLNDPRMADWAQALDSPVSTDSAFRFGWGGNMAFHRTVWLDVGGFDESYRRGFNEVDFFALAYEAGVPFVWVDDARVQYRLPASARTLLVRVLRHGDSLVTFCRKHPLVGMRPPTLRGTLTTALKMALRLPLAAVTSRRDAKQLVRSLAYQLGMLVGLSRRPTTPAPASPGR